MNESEALLVLKGHLRFMDRLAKNAGKSSAESFLEIMGKVPAFVINMQELAEFEKASVDNNLRFEPRLPLKDFIIVLYLPDSDNIKFFYLSERIGDRYFDEINYQKTKEDDFQLFFAYMSQADSEPKIRESYMDFCAFRGDTLGTYKDVMDKMAPPQTRNALRCFDDFKEPQWLMLCILYGVGAINQSMINYPNDTAVVEKRIRDRMRLKGLNGFTYRSVKITPYKPPEIRHEHQGGTHASPREHDRRGHYRHLKSGNTVWVNACRVGSSENGTVQHDYILDLSKGERTL